MNKVFISEIFSASRIVAAAMFVAVLIALVAVAQSFAAKPHAASGEHLMTIHDRGIEKGFLTKADTVGEALSRAGVSIGEQDLVEPSLDEELVAKSYQINIYRAVPIVVDDGESTVRIISAYQTPEQIAQQAGIKLHDEDVAVLETTGSIVDFGAALRLDIDRATEFQLVLYGKKTTAYSQKTTVAAMLKEKNIKIGEKDTLSVGKDVKLKSGMTVEIWRNGKQTVTEEKSIPFPVKQIQDVNREVGYRKIKSAGEKGKKLVTYEVVMKNGKEVSRKEIQSVVTKKPVQQVEIVGAKPSFSGDFAAALAKLRSCEGGYNSWNPAGPYYGAYQFDERTWNSVSDAPYGNATPAQQDAAAHALYMRRGWQPWPVCGAPLPDTYR